MPDIAIRADVTQERLNRLNFLLSRECGPAFLQAFVKNTAEIFAADSVFIGRIDATNSRIRTLRVSSNGVVVENYGYELRGTPCAETIETGATIYEAGLS